MARNRRDKSVHDVIDEIIDVTPEQEVTPDASIIDLEASVDEVTPEVIQSIDEHSQEHPEVPQIEPQQEIIDDDTKINTMDDLLDQAQQLVTPKSDVNEDVTPAYHKFNNVTEIRDAYLNQDTTYQDKIKQLNNLEDRLNILNNQVPEQLVNPAEHKQLIRDVESEIKDLNKDIWKHRTSVTRSDDYKNFERDVIKSLKEEEFIPGLGKLRTYRIKDDLGILTDKERVDYNQRKINLFDGLMSGVLAGIHGWAAAQGVDPSILTEQQKTQRELMNDARVSQAMRDGKLTGELGELDNIPPALVHLIASNKGYQEARKRRMETQNQLNQQRQMDIQEEAIRDSKQRQIFSNAQEVLRVTNILNATPAQHVAALSTQTLEYDGYPTKAVELYNQERIKQGLSPVEVSERDIELARNDIQSNVDRQRRLQSTQLQITEQQARRDATGSQQQRDKDFDDVVNAVLRLDPNRNKNTIIAKVNNLFNSQHRNMVASKTDSGEREATINRIARLIHESKD